MTPRAPGPGRVVLVTGASRGIGAAIARAFAATGHAVVLAARDADALNRVADTIRGSDGAVLTHPVDVTDEESVRTLLDHVDQHFGRLDAAVNNAGGNARRPALLDEWTAAEFRAVLAANLTGTFLSMKYEIGLMRRGGGAIVNLSSTGGQQGVPGLAGYVAAKHGVEGLTRVAALDYAAAGIRVNAIAPGPILTDRLALAGPAAQTAATAAVPLGRLGTPEDIAASAVWLCSPDSSYVTGTTLTVDGGRLAGPWVTSAR